MSWNNSSGYQGEYGNQQNQQWGYGAPPGPPPNEYGGYGGDGYAPPSDPPAHHHHHHHHEHHSRGYPGQDYREEHVQQEYESSGGWGGQGNVATGGYYHEAYPPPNEPPRMPPSDVQHYGPQFQDGHDQQRQPYFQYSQCNGKKKALCIGINYIGQSAELAGCINDAHNVRRLLCERFGYQPDDIVLLTDDAENLAQIPTKANMERAMQWLVSDAQPNDSLFFHYSGHGGQSKATGGDEADGFDEVIYPVDYEEAGHIVDNDMHFMMVKPLPTGCRLTSIFDSCHSGSVLDLPYMYSTEGKIKEPNLLAEAGQGLLTSGLSYMRGDMKGVVGGLKGIFQSVTGSEEKADAYAKATRTSPADVISWSGCNDEQTSADTVEVGQSTGAMSYAFIDAINQNPQQTYQQLLGNIRTTLRNKYSQKPQLSSSHPMDTNIMFIC